MLSISSKFLFRAVGSTLPSRLFSSSTKRLLAETKKQEGAALRKGAKRDPELYILLAIMSGAFGMAGYYFGKKPTAATSESPVSIAEKSSPWKRDVEQVADSGAYQYYPGGDRNAVPKDAPSALNSVVVPNVNLPKRLHDKYNKWGKEGY